MIKMGEYQIKAYVWVTAKDEDEAEEKFKRDNMVLDIVEIEELE